MKQIFTIFLVVACAALGWGQTVETFSNLGPYDGYQTETWSGDNGFGTWTATDARTDQTIINGKAITVRNGDLTSPSISGGIGTLTLTTQRKFSGGSGDLDVIINGNPVGSIPYSGSAQTSSISNINVSGSFTIVIETPGNGDRVAMDDLTWTAFAGSGSLLTSSAASLSGLDYQEGNGPSTEQSFSLSGTSLDGSNVTLTAPANFEISQSAMGSYGASLTLNSYNGSATDIYVRLASGLSIGSYMGNIDIDGGGASSISVSLSGIVNVIYDITEPFDNYPETGSSYENGDFSGVVGNTWEYFNGRGNPQINGRTVVLQDNSSAKLSTTLNGGITDFSFDYMQAFSTNVNLEVYVDGNLVATVTSSNEQNSVKNSGNIKVSGVSGTYDLEFRRGSGGGQVAIDNFAWAYVSAPMAPFPITLSHFTARPTGSSVQLDWHTATELNNDYMEVEHSTDGRNYRKIGTVKGAGTTQEEQVYNFLHESPAAGLNYYRLLQVDYDGAYEYHGPVSVRMSGGDKLGGALSLFPTVASEAVQVEYEGQLSNEAELQVIGMDGRVWRTQRWETKSASLSLPVEDLPAGMYLLRLQVGRDVEVARFVKQ